MRIALLALVFTVPFVTSLGCSGGKGKGAPVAPPSVTAEPAASVTPEPTATPEATPEPTATPEASASPVASASPSPSAPAAPGGCELQHETIVAGKAKATLSKGGSVEATAFLTNKTATEMKLVVRDRCPQTLVSFKGFGKIGIYDGSCMMGICATTGDDKTITLAPGVRTEVSGVELRTKMPCESSLVRPGSYTLDFDLAVKGKDPTRCHTTAKVTVK